MLAQVSRTLVRTFHRTFELTLLVGLAMVHVDVLARRWLLPAFAACCRAASRGNLVRTCKHDCFVLVYCSLQCCCALAAASFIIIIAA